MRYRICVHFYDEFVEVFTTYNEKEYLDYIANLPFPVIDWEVYANTNTREIYIQVPSKKKYWL